MASAPCTLQTFCAERGISPAVASALRWRVDGHWLRMPVYDLAGDLRQIRQKNLRRKLAPHEAKYNKSERQGDPQDVTYKYYHAPDLRQAIAEAGGRLLIANGEPAAAAMLSAGRAACSIGFGEGIIPVDLIAWLTGLGVTSVLYCPDRDDKGRDGATRLRDALAGSRISYDCRALPETLPAKADLNDLWQAVAFDAHVFAAELHNLAPFTDWTPAPAPKPAPKTPRAHSPTTSTVDWPAERETWLRTYLWPFLVARAPEQKGRGKRERITCPLHSHHDNHPSFGIGDSGLPVCTCAITHHEPAKERWDVVARDGGALAFKEWFKAERAHLYPDAAKASGVRSASKIGSINGNSSNLNAAQNGTEATFTTRSTADTSAQADATYLSAADLPRSGVVLIAAPMGSGKTEAVFSLLREMDAEFLSITHRVALATGQAARATRSGLTLASYKDVSELAQLAQIGSVAVCINTLALAAKAELARPRLRVVVLDEVKQLLRAIGEEHGTMRGDAPVALKLLKQAISEADLVLAMDAHADAWTLRELELLAGKSVTLVQHAGMIDRPPVTLYHDRRALRDALAALMSGSLGVGCASEREARDVYRELAPLVADDARILLTAETAGTTKGRAFLADPNTETPRYQLIVYSPVVGTGMDIQATIDTLALLDAGRHLTGEDLAQMAGRFRRARQIVGWIRPDLDKERMTADQLSAYLIALEKADHQRAGHVFDLDTDGRCVLPEHLAQFYGFQGRVMAENQRGIDQARTDFVRAFPRFTVSMAQGNKEAADARKLRHQAAVEAEIALAATVEPISQEDYDRLSEAQGVDDEQRAGLLRWQIEDMTGRPYTQERGRLLYESADRLAARRLSYSAVDHAAMADEDADELATGRLVLNRARRVLFKTLGSRLQAALVKDGQPVNLNAAQLAELDTALMADIGNEATEIAVFGYDRAPKTARGRVAAICRKLGLRLTTERCEAQQDGERVRWSMFRLDAAGLTAWQELARQIGERTEARWYEKAKSPEFSELVGKKYGFGKVGGIGATPDRPPAPPSQPAGALIYRPWFDEVFGQLSR